MMKYYKTAEDVIMQSFSKKNKKFYADTIYTFDLESTSMFYLPEGEGGKKWQPFDYDDCIDYRDIPRAAVSYIWMFGIEDTVYYGRELDDFEDMLKLISNPMYRKVIWVHNLAFEMSFLEDILSKYTIEEMIARDKRKPIQFYIKELNIMFRCSYMLTNMSLANAAKEYTKIEKKTGDLDYNELRSPLTELTPEELGYCEYDILCLREIILAFLHRYKNSIANIPLTSTGTVRKEIQHAVDYFYIKRMQDLIPPVHMYLRMWWAFSGGYTHANVVRSSQLITGRIFSMDIASSYPAVLVTEKYCYQPFRYATVREFMNPKKREQYGFLLKVEFEGLESRFYNHYLQYEKVKTNVVNPVTDNGRIVSCDYCTYWCCDTDVDIMMVNYKYKSFKITECYKSRKAYLDIRIIKFILDLYKKKCTLKGFTSDDPEEVEQVEAVYRASKALINGIFGICCQNVLHTAEYKNHQWCVPDTLNPDLDENKGKTADEMFKEFVTDKLDEAKDSYSTLFFYFTGVQCTAYARRNLLMRVFSSHEFDKAVIYMDTDSCKYTGNFDYIFEDYNNQMIEKYKKVIEYYPEISIEDFMPEDRKGVKHPIGFFEFDGEYSEFITHGAKKYAYRNASDNTLHITVSGVSKKGVSALYNDIHNFTKNFRWGYSESGKLMHTYIDNQDPVTFTDKDGNIYTTHNKHAVVLQPTSYTLGLTPYYEMLIYYFQLGSMRRFIK